ncbi:MAG TPA: topoisomerase C-terminal repeat-containing protein, partial [Rhodanobacteraceae bacterium]|nr:topoisomerase C-terminal repeat-containing protein [Rhodanobacteraceae bacterium]
TAKLEDELDAVSRGEEDWHPLLQRFWTPFKQLVDEKTESVDRGEATGTRSLGVDPVSGKEVTVRLGRYGPFAQIGSKEAGDPPRYASLRPGQSMHTIALADAVELFKLPRDLGLSPQGEKVSVGVGRFGPFVKQGDTYASLKAEDDPYTIDLAVALERVREKREIAANRLIKDFGNGVQVLNGRYGPYITDGEKNARIPKEREPATLTAEECAALLAAAPVRPKRGFARGGKGAGAAKKTAARKTAAAAAAPAKPAAVKKTAARKTAAGKPAAKKTTAKKTAVRKTATRLAPPPGDTDR